MTRSVRKAVSLSTLHHTFIGGSRITLQLAFSVAWYELTLRWLSADYFGPLWQGYPFF
jgi:hypothetical protein